MSTRVFEEVRAEQVPDGTLQTTLDDAAAAGWKLVAVNPAVTGPSIQDSRRDQRVHVQFWSVVWKRPTS